MMKKRKHIAELYDQTCKFVTSSAQNWMAFLTSASRNYRLRYDEQLLVFAQRPDATAILSIQRWNRSYGRWVNQGAKGIAVFDDRENTGIRYYFDISDTHESQYAKSVFIWQMKDIYTSEVIQTLESAFGELHNKENLGDAILSAVGNAIEERREDIVQNLSALFDGAVDMEEERILYETLVACSAAYMIMNRTGIDPSEYFAEEAFRDIQQFNTRERLNTLGVTIHDITEEGLIEISRIVSRLDRRIVENGNILYNKVGENSERRSNDDRNDIYESRRLQSAGSGEHETGEPADESIREKEETVSEREPQNSVLQLPDERDVESASVGDSAESLGTGRDSDEENVQGTGDYRRVEESGYDELGAEDEQSEELRTGDRDEGSRIRIEVDPEEVLPSYGSQLSFIEMQAEEKASAFSIPQDVVNKALSRGSGFIGGKYRIYEYITHSLSITETAAFLKKEYGVGGWSHAGGAEYNLQHDSKGICIAKGYGSEVPQIHLSWIQVAQRIKELIRMERYLIPEEKEQYDERVIEEEIVEPIAEEIVPEEESPVEEIPPSYESFKLTEHVIESVGAKERFRRNLIAIRILKDCEEKQRMATPEEQIALSKYVGWGGLSEAFDEKNPSWSAEYQQLKTLLSEEEYVSARESTLTAFYTPQTVIQGVYQALEQFGFKEGNILEPSCGVGHFIGMLPDAMKNSRMYGVEIDGISAGIARYLYPNAEIRAQPFEESPLPDSFFDAVIGNVPFGDFRVSDKRYDKHKFLIHDYFFAKSLDKLRPGGVLILITSKGTMDKESPAVRRYIAQRADLLGAVRLPNNAFKGNAGTEVVSDILILQKRERMIDIEPEWVQLQTNRDGIRVNSYFVEHPDMILGTMKIVKGRFGEEVTCEPYEGSDLKDLLTEAISKVQGEITIYENIEELDQEESIPADPNIRNFSYTMVEDRIYFRENSRMVPITVTEVAGKRIEGMIAIRESVRKLIRLQTEDYPEQEIQQEQKHLNELYDAFIEKYGLLNSRSNAHVFSQDSSFALLASLEILNEEGELDHKADMFYKRTIKPSKVITAAEHASEALALSIGEKAQIDMDYMCQLLNQNEEQIYQDLQGVIFRNPLYEEGGIQQKYLMADEYLSGNVRHKLMLAKQAAAIEPDVYNVHVAALEQVQPKDLSASEISVRLGAVWLPADVVEDFVFDFLDTPRYMRWKMKIHFSPYTSEWYIENKSLDRGNVKVNSTYGTDRIGAYKIIEETLNLRDVRIFDYIEDAEGKKKPVLNKKETAIAQAKQELIKQGFQDWVWQDPSRRERLTKLYNEKFNSIRPREYDGRHITFHGMNPEIELREHQRNAVAHILYGGNTLLAHAVGAGKTFEMVAAAQESRLLGLCNKSMFVVPNHLIEQWASEYLQLYPSANLLVASKKDFETKNRKKFCGRIATGDYDAVIIGHSQFEKIPMSIERQRRILEMQIDELTDGIMELKRNRGENYSIKQLEKSRKAIKIRLEKLNDQSRKDDVITFEELGVDRLFIDESHYYKNLYLHTKMRNVGGIAQTEAQKSSDLFMKCRYLDEITGGRGIVFATGTPISNSMVELYTIQRYLQYNTLQRNGLQHFDAWASTFGETVTAVELTPEGTGYRAKTRFAKFYNLPELMSMFKEVADIKTADMLHLPVPKAKYHNVSVKPSEMQKEMVEALSERAEKVRTGGIDSSIDNMLKITNDGRKLALDQRMVNDMLPDFEGSKLNACVENVYKIWSDTADRKSTQLIFCDLSTPKKDGTFSVYNDIREKLIQRGIPEKEIEFIHDAGTDAKKKELFQKTRKGEVRILIGSTQKMGAGTNVQDKLIALHDVDCPWRPSDLEQRSGRIIRQGNENPEVEIFRYVTEQTFDAYLYQLVEGKQKFGSQIMTSKSPVRSAEDIDETALSYAEIKMLATGNPHIKEKMDLDIQVQRLRLLKSSFLSEKYALEDRILKYFPYEIKKYQTVLHNLRNDVQCVEQHPKFDSDNFGMEIQGVFYNDKEQAGKAILSVCKELKDTQTIRLGEYRGFPMEIHYEGMLQAFEVILQGRTKMRVALSNDVFGNITRIDNGIERFKSALKETEETLENLQKQLEIAKEEVQKPFVQEEELKAKTARLDELNILLNMDKAENVIMGEEPDEGELAANQRKVKAYER